MSHTVLSSLAGAHLLSIEQLHPDTLQALLATADTMRPYALRQKRCTVLQGALLANLFFEPSTRTRVSFGAAFSLLGGQVLETTGMGSSALSKGESLKDMAQVMSGYVDAIAMRHPEDGSVAQFAQGSSVPVINGGDGSNEHPTQALLDLYTLHHELARVGKSLDKLHIGLMGDLKHGRTVHSLVRLLRHYPQVRFTFISPPELAIPHYLIELLNQSGHAYTIEQGLNTPLDVDVIYQTRVQEERFASIDEANHFRGALRLHQQSFFQYFDPTTVIMHPLPRDSRSDANELATDLDELSNLAIFRQAHNGVLMRMAIFAHVLGVADIATQHEAPVLWYSNKI